MTAQNDRPPNSRIPIRAICRALGLVLTALCLAVASAGGASAQGLLAPTPLETGDGVWGPSSSDLYSQERGVTFDFDLLAQNNRSGQTLDLDLFGDLSLQAQLESLEVRGEGNYSWFGRLAGEETSIVIFSVYDRAVSGMIQGKDGVFSLRTQESGAQVLWELNSGQALPKEQAPWMVSNPGAQALYTQNGWAASGLSANSDTLDIMILFSDQAAEAAGNMRSLGQLAVDLTNAAFSRSGVGARLNLVNAAHISYRDSGSSSTDLFRLQDSGDGHLDDVHGRRDRKKADLVSLWVKDLNDGTAGIAYLLNNLDDRAIGANAGFAFTVVDLDYAVDQLVFPHEVGHNLGAHHDWYVSRRYDGALFRYSHGHINVDKGWYTLMSYPWMLTDLGWRWEDIRRIPYFSNPEIRFEGDSTGVSRDYPFPADNTATINQSAGYVSRYR